jgi:hypothetical protein
MKLSKQQWSSVLLIGIGLPCHYYYYIKSAEKGLPIFLFFVIWGTVRLILPLLQKKKDL